MSDTGHKTDSIIMRCGLCGHDIPMPIGVGVDGAIYVQTGEWDRRHICHGAISYEQAVRLDGSQKPAKKKAAKPAAKRGTR